MILKLVFSRSKPQEGIRVATLLQRNSPNHTILDNSPQHQLKTI